MSDKYVSRLPPVRPPAPIYQSPIQPAVAGSASTPHGLTAMRAAGRASMFLVPAAILAATAVANVPGIEQASTNWDNGLSMPLDDGVKMTSPNIINASRKIWKAQDQEAFEAAVARMSGEVAKLRESFKTIGGTVDEIGGTYRKYWMEIAALAVVLIGAVTALMIAKAVPWSRAFAIIKEAILGKIALGTVSGLLMQLAYLLGSSSRAMAMEARKWHQLNYVNPSGALSIDFQKAKIDMSGLPSLQPQPQPGQLPPGSDQFKWIAPEKPA